VTSPILGERPSGWTRIEINDVPPSANELRREYRHWAVYRDLREKWTWLLQAELVWLRLSFVRELRPKMSVNITIYRPRRLDDDNARGGCKPVWDAMKDIGLIRNDSLKWLDSGVSQMIGPERTIIEFRECGK
jgi:hypothetical protein